MKACADNQKSALSPEVKPGDAVRIKQPKTTKLTPDYRPHPYTVVRVKGTMVTAKRGNHWTTGNVSFYKKIPPELVSDDNMQSEENDDDDDDWPSKPQLHSMKPARTAVANPPAEKKNKPMEEVRRRYPQRERRPSRFYIDANMNTGHTENLIPAYTHPHNTVLTCNTRTLCVWHIHNALYWDLWYSVKVPSLSLDN